MGSLTIDGIVVQFEDRVLTHLQIVIVQKLRKGESFLMSWRDSDAVGDGRSSAWIHPSLSLYFKFSGSRVPAINRDWLASLMASASGSQGLIVTSEDNYANPPPPSRRRRRAPNPPRRSTSRISSRPSPTS